MKISKHFIKLINAIYKSIKRFPISIAFSTAFVILMIITSEINQPSASHINQMLERVCMILALGFAASLCIKIYIEKKDVPKLSSILPAYIVLGISLILYYLFLLKDFSMVSTSRYTGITIVLYICFVFIPYFKDKKNFELYVIKIFGRFFITVIYSAVLFAGLSAILFTIETLLEINIPENFYYYTFLIVAGIFAPSYYLGGLPSKDEAFTKENYPNIFRVLVLYIIIPLISAYTLILYIYFAKIIITAKWPVGLISHLVLWYSVISCAVLFFISPLYKDNKYVNTFMKILPKAILPLIILMFFSIGMRIKAYGITENRYYVVALSLWTFGVMIYFAFSKHFKNIFLPVTFCIIIIISVFGGPVSSYSVSISSQNNRFTKILKNNQMLKDNQIVKNSSVTIADKNEISSIIKYFDNNHQLKDLKYVPQNFKLQDTSNVFGFALTENTYYAEEYFNYEISQNVYPIDISGYDYMFGSTNMNYNSGNSALKVTYDYSSNEIKLSRDDKIIYSKNLNEFISKIKTKYETSNGNTTVDSKDMCFEDENSDVKIKFYMVNANGMQNENSDKLDIKILDYYLLIKLK